MTEEEIITNLKFIENNLSEIKQNEAIKKTIVKFKNYLYKNQTVDVQLIVRIIWGEVFSGYRKGRVKAEYKVGDYNWFRDLKDCMIENEFFLDCQFKRQFSLLTYFMHRNNSDSVIKIIHSLQKNNTLDYVVKATNNYATFTNLVNGHYTKFANNMSESGKKQLGAYVRLAIKINQEIKAPEHKVLSTSIIENCTAILDAAAIQDNISVDTDKDSILRFTSMKRVQSPDLLDFLTSKRLKLTSQ